MKALILSACVALLAVSVPAAAGDAAAGEKKSATCTNAACHGPGGNGTTPEIPRLAGQYYDYLLKAMGDYKSGVRKGPIMQPMVEKLTRRDMEDLAAYFSQQQGVVGKH